jgi:hypothetical protein
LRFNTIAHPYYLKFGHNYEKKPLLGHLPQADIQAVRNLFKQINIITDFLTIIYLVQESKKAFTSPLINVIFLINWNIFRLINFFESSPTLENWFFFLKKKKNFNLILVHRVLSLTWKIWLKLVAICEYFNCNNKKKKKANRFPVPSYRAWPKKVKESTCPRDGSQQCRFISCYVCKWITPLSGLFYFMSGNIFTFLVNHSSLYSITILYIIEVVPKGNRNLIDCKLCFMKYISLVQIFFSFSCTDIYIFIYIYNWSLIKMSDNSLTIKI